MSTINELETRVTACIVAKQNFDEWYEDPVGIWQQLYAIEKGWAN